MTPRLYEGTKRLLATPMTRGAYNQYRGWETPADENPKDEGYLVEYQDGGKANDARHANYISWSPKDVFDRSYKELPVSTLPPHQQRVLNEKQELDIRITRLDEFIQRNALFRELDPEEQARMRRQLDVMRELSVIFGERVKGF